MRTPGREQARSGSPRWSLGVLLTGALLLGLGAVPRPSEAQSEPGPGREIHDTLGVSVHQLGLQNATTVEWKRPLFESNHPLLSGAHVSWGASHALTPAYTRLAVWAEIGPLSILDVRAGVEPSAYFGTFGSLLSFRGAREDFSPAARTALEGQAHAETAVRLYASPTLKMKVGPIVAVAGADLEWWHASAPGAFFYEPARDTLLGTHGGRMVGTSSLLLWQGDPRLAVGFTHALTGVPAAPRNRIQRAGVLASRALGSSSRLRHARLLGTVFYYLEDPYKRHQFGGALALGFDLGRS